jgi:arylsulfatase A-like enzyme
MKWIKRVGKKHKFFAYIHYLDLHSPYEPKPPYDTLYLNKTDKEDLGRFDYPRALYDGQLTYIDTEIGTLLDDLKKEGLYDNTLVIITSDHGDEFGQHGAIGHSKVPYDEVIRVPLIIKFPESLYAGTVVENQVRLIDIKPTILDYLKIEPHTELSGFSLMNYLDSNEDRNHHQIDFPRYAISEIYNMVQDLDVLAIRTEEFKYIHFKNKDDELYDLKADPEEQNNLIKKHPEVAEKFNQMLPPILAEKNQKRVKQVSLDKKTIEELKALGYIQ